MKKKEDTIFRRRNKFISILILVILIVAGCRKSPTSSEPSWQEVKSPTVKNLNSVFALSEENVWAVGECATIIHWNGEEWHPVVSHISCESLNDVYFTKDSDGWVVGANGIILHYNGNEWWPVAERPTKRGLSSCYFLSSTEGWAVGDSGVILHYDGSEWSLKESPITEFLASVYFPTSEEGWAVGSYEVILHYKNSEWEIFSYDSMALSELDDIYFLSPDNGFAVGYGWTTGGPYQPSGIQHYDGTDWSTKASFDLSLHSISFVNSSEGWAVGGGGIVHYKDGEWTVEIKFEWSESGWFSVFSLPSGVSWAVGSQGKILCYESQ